MIAKISYQSALGATSRRPSVASAAVWVAIQKELPGAGSSVALSHGAREGNGDMVRSKGHHLWAGLLTADLLVLLVLGSDLSSARVKKANLKADGNSLSALDTPCGRRRWCGAPGFLCIARAE